MEQHSSNNATTAPRKVRFAPKARPRIVPKPAETKIEVTNDTDVNEATELMRRFNDGLMKRKPEVGRKLPSAKFGIYGGSSTSVKKYGGFGHGSATDKPSGDAFASCTGVHKEYNEPWDYYSYYPETLPVRRPYSGNPELLDEVEFGETSESTRYDENSVKPAIELGLMEENTEATMFFLQLPAILPMAKHSATPNVSLDELPAGLMGKMQVYKSGAIKLKLGDTLYDVSPGLDCVFAQDLVAINTVEKHCCTVGELNKRVIVTPNVDSILSSLSDLG